MLAKPVLRRAVGAVFPPVALGLDRCAQPLARGAMHRSQSANRFFILDSKISAHTQCPRREQAVRSAPWATILRP